MMGVRIIHRPEAEHQCDLPTRWDRILLGTVAVCEECGTAWVFGHDDWTSGWRPVGPWPFDRKARRALRAYRKSGGTDA